jgi:hypothetical protein
MVGQQDQTQARLVGQPLRRLQSVSGDLRQGLQKLKRGRVIHTSPILTDKTSSSDTRHQGPSPQTDGQPKRLGSAMIRPSPAQGEGTDH